MDNRVFYKFVCLFGDAKSHSALEIGMLGMSIVKYDKKLYKKMFNRLLEWGLINRLRIQNNIESDDFILSEKGDKFIREKSIFYGGDSSYYTMMDRSAKSYAKYGKD